MIRTLVTVAIVLVATVIGTPVSVDPLVVVESCPVIQTGMFYPCADLDASFVIDRRGEQWEVS